MPRNQGDKRTPTYEGRPLARPDEEIVDQGLGFDLGTLMGRRQMLRAFGLGAATLGLAACGNGSGGGSSTAAATASSSGSSGEIPQETAGPYPGDGSNGPDILEQSGVVRSDLRSSLGGASGTAEGVPMTLELTIKDLANGGAALAGQGEQLLHCGPGGP
jgi:hypothetical protein